MPYKAPIVALIDDDKIFQLTAYKTIKATAITESILQFENGELALNYLKENLKNETALPDYIFLDINMPFVDGWMFLDDYEQLKSGLAKSISIYMVSSSIDPRDVDRAKQNTSVKDYVVKPVTREKFIQLLKSVSGHG
jgi:two-component system, chemotaxis family, chemotaxis protein CheY